MQPADFHQIFLNLNEEQKRAVTGTAPYQLVVAGAGSGKTRVLTARAAWLCAQGVSPDRILLLTFTNKAARQMRDRLVAMGAQTQGLWAGTFHAIAHRLIQPFASQIGYQPGFAILSAQESLEICQMAREAVVGDNPLFPKAEWLQAVFSHAQNIDCELTEFVRNRFPKFASEAERIDRVCTEYLRRKLAQNAMDYDDLLVNLRLLLEDCPQFQQAVSARFLHVLIDEYQDTNRLQVALIRQLNPKNLMAVGDDCQSIYAFRGADLRNFLQFHQDFPGAALYRLETCYRCTPQIVALANASISKNREQFHKVLHSALEDGPKPFWWHLNSVGEQARKLVQRVIALRDEGVPLSEQAILFRAHYQSMELQLELQKQGIPFEIRGGIRFFDQAHIRDLLAHFRILQTPMDRNSWLRALRLRPHVGLRTAESIFEALSVTGDPWGQVRALATVQKASRVWNETRGFLLKIEALKNSPMQMVQAILDSGYRDALQRSYENAAERLDEILQLAQWAENSASIQQFLDELTWLEDSTLERESGEAPLCLSTVHQAKGLEWTAVFLLSVAQGLFPLRRALSDPQQLEEERRLFYVAVTRARRWLYLCSPQWGSMREGYLDTSCFLTELGANGGSLLTSLWAEDA